MSDLHWGTLIIQIYQNRNYIFLLYLLSCFGFFMECTKINVDLIAVEPSVPVPFVSVCRNIHNRVTDYSD